MDCRAFREAFSRAFGEYERGLSEIYEIANTSAERAYLDTLAARAAEGKPLATDMLLIERMHDEDTGRPIAREAIRNIMGHAACGEGFGGGF